MKKRTPRVAALAVCAAVVLPAVFVRAAGSPRAAVTITYSYDAAGRLVAANYPGGRSIRYEYDPSGNLLARKTGVLPEFHFAVKKPATGAWAFEVSDAGEVQGYGADTARGAFGLGGTFAIDGAAATGRIDLLSPADGSVVASHPVVGKVKRVKKTGAIKSVKLKAAQPGKAAALAAAGVPVTGGNTSFAAVFGSARNQIVVGATAEALGPVTLADDPSRWFACTLSGALTGALVADPKGKAYGEIVRGPDRHLVVSKLAAGQTTVKLASPKGAPVKVKATLGK